MSDRQVLLLAAGTVAMAAALVVLAEAVRDAAIVFAASREGSAFAASREGRGGDGATGE